MRRRTVLAALLGSMAAGVPPFAHAQNAPRKLGWLATTAQTFKEPYSQAFVQRLAELGFGEGRTLIIERRHTGGRLETAPAMAAELARAGCEVFFFGGPEALLLGLKQADSRTPIVFLAIDFDAIAAGHVRNPSRPEGRMTGLNAVQSILPGKRVELMKELLPGARKLAVFTNDHTGGQLAVAQEAAARLGLTLHPIHLTGQPFDYEAAFAEAARQRADGLIVLASGLFVPARRRITELALKARLPSSFQTSHWTEAGGLMSYGFNFPQMWRRAADMVAALLRGGRPGDIPVEQPATYEFSINAKTARALGLHIPETIRIRVDTLID